MNQPCSYFEQSQAAFASYQSDKVNLDELREICMTSSKMISERGNVIRSLALHDEAGREGENPIILTLF